MSESRKGYLVRWRRCYCYLRTNWTGSKRTPGQHLMRLFATEAEAEAYREALQAGRVPVPAEANPFLSFADGYDGRETTYPSLACLTAMPEPIFLDLVRDLGFEPPVEEEKPTRGGESYVSRDWYNWWLEHAPRMGEVQRCRIWQSLDLLWFFEVVEVSMAADVVAM